MASTRRRVVGKGAGGSGGAAPGEAATEPARHISEAELEVFTHTDFLTRENLRQELPRLLQQLVSPSPDAGDGAGRRDVFQLLAEAHFAAEAQVQQAKPVAAVVYSPKATNSLPCPQAHQCCAPPRRCRTLWATRWAAPKSQRC